MYLLVCVILVILLFLYVYQYNLATQDLKHSSKVNTSYRVILYPKVESPSPLCLRNNYLKYNIQPAYPTRPAQGGTPLANSNYNIATLGINDYRTIYYDS